MFLEGVILMLTGMGVVFLFLIIMVLLTKYSGALITRYEAAHKEDK